ASTETLAYRHVPLRPREKPQAKSAPSQGNVGVLGTSRRVRLRPDYEIITYDLLMVWDLVSVLAIGYGCVVGSWLTDAASQLSASPAWWQDPLPLIGALLAP